ncbi:hypothetical protein AcV7_008352 [Taiwanofungus camphoratus]|nr:hypothetical protein AcV7_008352 [Antrodia cinnamomea]
MATLSAGDVNKQLWDEALTRLLDLSTATVKRNAELEARVTELEMELSVWKTAHSTVVEMAEREKKAHNAQVATLNRQISVGVLQNQNPLIICAIDGDANIFSQSLLSKGLQGGCKAAQELTKGIAEYLSQEEMQVFGRLSFWVTIYFNKRGLLNMLREEGLCTTEQFEAFMSGLSQASPRFLVVDVGPAKDGAEVKIKEYIQTYTALPQTLRIFCACNRDSNYKPFLSKLEKDELIGKLVILQGSDGPPEDLRQLSLPVMQVEGLFMGETPTSSSRRFGSVPGPIPLVGLNNNVTTRGGLISPQSETQSPTPPAGSGGNLKPIDPTKPLHKQMPPPCNEHYLMTCSKGVNCKYSHEWDLTKDQLETLAKNAKGAPCNYLKNGLECPHGERCCWGHVCPSGARCFHLSKGKCWFKGEGMHSGTGFQEN